MILSDLKISWSRNALETAPNSFPRKAAEINTLASMIILAINFASHPIKSPECFFFLHPCLTQNPSDVQENGLRVFFWIGVSRAMGFLRFITTISLPAFRYLTACCLNSRTPTNFIFLTS